MLNPIATMIVCLIFILGSIIMSIPLYYGFVAGILFTGTVLYKKGHSFKDIIKSLVLSVKDIRNLLIIILLIGATTSIWLSSGVVPTIMYYGFSYMEGVNFLLAAFLIMCTVSVFMGTAVGTLSTVGLSLWGIGLGMGIPRNLMVGVLVSGAFMADKISPLSGLLNLMLTTVNIKYKDALKSMIITLIPTLLVTSIIYFILGQDYTMENVENITLFKKAIGESFNTSPILIVLPATVLLLSVRGVNPLITFPVGVVLGSILTLVFQQGNILSIIKSLVFGYRGNTTSAELNNLLVSGGMVSMIEAILIVVGAFALIRLFEEGNMLIPLIDKFVQGINRRITLIGRTGLLSILMTAATCDQTAGIILPGTILQEKYKELKLSNSVLARTIFDTGVTIAPLMPWNVNSFLIKPIMGISAIHYAPYAALCYVCPIVTIIISYLQYRDKNVRESF